MRISDWSSDVCSSDLHHLLAAGYPAEDAAGVVGAKPVRRHRVAVLAAPRSDGDEPIADLHALDRVDRHHRRGQFRVDLAVHPLAPARPPAAGPDPAAPAARVAGLALGRPARFPLSAPPLTQLQDTSVFNTCPARLLRPHNTH